MTAVQPVFSAARAAEAALAAFARLGYERQPPMPVRAPEHDTTLFVSGGIQNWRRWVELGGAGEARTGAQWCVRTNRLDDVGITPVLTSFCMISAVRLGPRGRAAALTDVLSVLSSIGLSTGRLAFIVTTADQGRQADDESVAALRRLGFGDDRIAGRPRRWAQPFRPGGVTGPNLFVLVERGAACSADCSPLCGCGRFLHFLNCEFLDRIPTPHGGLAPAPLPVVDIGCSVEWLGCALTGADRAYDIEPLAGARSEALRILGGPEPSATDLSILVDHGRTVALLLGNGIRPGPRAHGHVARRLLRRMLTVLLATGRDPALVADLVRAAATSGAAGHGFPEPAEIEAATSTLNTEATSFVRGLARGRHRLRLLLSRTGPGGSAEVVFRVRSEQGVPLPVLLAWCAESGVEIDRRRLDDLLHRQRSGSKAESTTQGWRHLT
nr:alanine--tRNA ligase-related protein [Micromonospora sp. DSM 115978]